MCGRYTLRRKDVLEAAMAGVDLTPVFEEFTEHPRFNIAPSQCAPVVRLNSHGQRTLSELAWGLVPSWTKGKPKLRPINAKCETAASSAMFRAAMGRRRCLVPADGFFEWKGAKPPKQPYFIHLIDDAPFAFAGLWERWKAEGADKPIDTFTILTTTPNELMKPIHNRMPVILSPRDYERWLDPKNTAADVADLLKPFDASAMQAHPVSTAVNKPANQGPELIEPVD